MNKIVRLIHKDRELKNAIINACKHDGDPLTPQAIDYWKKLPLGVPAKRVHTVARVMRLPPQTIRPDIFK